VSEDAKNNEGPAIALDHVRKVFEGAEGAPVVAVDDVVLEVAHGETLALIGTSGCGKTTLLRMINRLLEPSGGTILVEGQDIREQDVIRLRRRIGYVIQSGGLFPHMSVARNIGLLCRLEKWKRSAIRDRVRTLLDLVNLPPDEFASRYPRDLSGGQRQRVGVARALAVDPPIILMDEPFGALDPITRAQLHAEFRELNARVHKTVVFVTHDLAEAFELGDRVAIMDAGRIVQVGTEEEFRARPANAFVADFLRAHLDATEHERGHPRGN
jgi:osmoprotectant transport system ATP-binding protein